MYDIFWYSDNIELAKQQAIANSKTEFAWVLCEAVDYNSFNLRWIPNRHEQTQCHVWGSHNNANTHTTWLLPINHLRANTTTNNNYHSDIILQGISTLDWKWIKDDRIDYTDFNFNWLPDSWQWDKNHAFAMRGTSQLAYTFLIKEGATETVYHETNLKFIDAGNEWSWIIDDRIDYTGFDFTWLPDAWDIDKEHCFAMCGTEKLSYTKLVNLLTPVTEQKFYSTNLKFKPNAADNEWQWITDKRIDYSEFNFDWLPDAWDVDKEHCFVMSGLEQLSYTKLINLNYEIKETKFHLSNLKFIDASDEWRWITDDRIDYTDFDFTWLPDAWDVDKEHCFTMKGCNELSYTKLINTTVEQTENKFHVSNLEFLSGAAIDEWKWITDDRIDYTDFDFTWLPDAWDVDKEHCFVMSGLEQLSYTKLINLKHEIKETKFHLSNLKFIDASDEWKWITDDRIDYTNFDFTWLPDAWDKTRVHCFTMKGCNELSYTKLINTTVEQTENKFHIADLEFLSGAAIDEWVWVTDPRIDYTDFDFTWLPDAYDIDKEHLFCMKGKEQLSYTRLYNNKQKITGKKFHLSNLEFIPNRSNEEWVWEIDPRIDYTGFDFTWLPDAWDIDKEHCFTIQGLTQLSYTRLYNSRHEIKETKFHITNLQFKPDAAKDEWIWEIDPRIDYTDFDFTWLPDAFDIDKNHYFCMKGKEQLSYTRLYNSKHPQTENKFHISNLEFIPGTTSDEWVWETDPRIDYTGFDFTWLPDAWDINKEHCFTMRRCEQLSYTKLYNAKHEIVSKKYHSTDLVFPPQAASDEWIWVTDPRIDYTGFDFNWLPDAWDIDKEHCFTMRGCKQLHYTKLYNSKHQQLTKKYHPTDLVFKDASDEWLWETDPRIDYTNFDFTWLPDEWELDHDHRFAMRGCEKLSYTRLYNKKYTQVNSKFHVSNLVFKPQAAGNEWVWETDPRIDYTNFDFNWLPDEWDINKEHYFTMRGCKQLSYTKLYNSKQTITGKKYHPATLTFKPRAASDEWVWETDPRIDYSKFDFNWLPDEWDINKEHLFAMNNCKQLSYTKLYNSKQTITGKKYHRSELKFILGKADNEWVWVTDPRIDYTGFDFTWLPDAWDINKEHLFAMHGCEKLSYTRLYNSTVEPAGKKYYPSNLKFKKDAAVDEWVWVTDPRIDYSNFDFTWLPDEWDINKEHYFTMRGCEQLSYTKLYNSKQEIIGTKYHDGNLIFKPNSASDEWVWETDPRIDYTNFDFNWLPDDWDLNKVHCFTMAGCKELSYTRLYNSKHQQTEDKFHRSNLKFIDEPKTIFWPEDITYDEQFDWVSKQDLKDEWVWICDSRIDYSKLNKEWLPDAWDVEKINCFSMNNQQQLSYTWLVNTKYLNKKDFKFHKSYLKFQKSIQDKLTWPNFVTSVLSGFNWQDSLANWVIEQELEKEWVWIIDERINYDDFDFTWLPDAWDNGFIHCFTMKDKEQLSYTWLVNTTTLKDKKFKYHTAELSFDEKYADTIFLDMGFGDSIYSAFKRIRFTGNMEAVVRSAVKRATSEWIWIGSTCADYKGFKFDWLPDLDKLDFAHCWPAPNEIKGETFLIHVPTFLRTNELKWDFDHEVIPRRPWPCIVYQEDNLANAINNNDRNPALYTLYMKSDTKIRYIPTPCLWEERPVVSLNDCNSASLVPRDCIVKKEIYEYPNLVRKAAAATSINLDIVFISNGERDSRLNGNRCYFIAPNDMRVHTSENVNGRLKAYQAAAEQSTSDWFLAVFAKCYMLDSFHDFKWRPDYWQQPKHYIFHNYNFDLGLTYGHMAPIAYNKKLMLENTGGLDMTLAQEHAVVPQVISETRLDDPWDTWRTAFRETVKLMYYSKTDDSIELEYRLGVWLKGDVIWTKDNPWYARGANDAKDYFESIDGEWAWIMVTNEWDWLRKRFDLLYSKDPLLQP